MSQNAPSGWQILASWSGAIAAWLGVLFSWWKRRQDRTAEMETKYGELADSREIFWSTLYEGYSRFRESNPTAPERLDYLIQAAGVPPDLLTRKGRDLRLWPSENLGKLSPDQRTLWKFVSVIYPPRDGRQGRVTDHSLIEPSDAKLFHGARGDLSRFWDVWVPSRSMRYFCKRYRSATEQTIILAWLEIVLVQWTQNRGEGKVELFKLAQQLSQS